MLGRSPESSLAIPQALGRLRVALEDAFLRASRDQGLSAQQAELLCAAMTPSAVGSLAVVLRCDRSNVSRLIDRSSKRGLIRRRVDQADGRITMVELTPEGLRLAQRFLAELDSQTADLRSEWASDRQQQAAALLDEISATLETSANRPVSSAQAPARPQARTRRVGKAARV